MDVYDFAPRLASGEMKSFTGYKGKVLLIVNTASKCGFVKQLDGLQKLYEEFHNAGFYVLAFPCDQFNRQEPLTNEEIPSFCSLNYNVTFPIFSKVDVKGKNTHPLFTYLTSNAPGLFSKQIKWNFTKFLVSRDGKVIKRFAPIDKPLRIKSYIKEALDK